MVYLLQNQILKLIDNMFQILRSSPFNLLFIFFVSNFFVSDFLANNLFAVAKSMVMFFFIFILAYKFLYKCFDLNALSIFVLCTFYGVISNVDGGFKTSFSISLIVMPAVLYAAGKWLAYKSHNSVQLITSFFLIGFALALPAIFAIFNNVSQFGFEGGGRNIALSDDGEAISATVLGGTLIVLLSFGGVIFGKNSKLGWKLNFLIGSFFLLSLLAATRLGSRTLLAVSGVCILFGVMNNLRNKNGWVSILIAFIGFLTIYSLLDNMSMLLDWNFYFRDRIDSDESGNSTAGGRLERWVSSLALIPSHPFGWGINEFGYAHNFWLDIARNGGWISFILSILLTISFTKNFKLALKNNRNDVLLSTFSICMSTGFLLLFMVEPIFDGFQYTFGIFCVYFGILNKVGNPSLLQERQ